uniref:Uncharacterized protein n=1 Tax=Rhizophora mucronata TaxID=61149 RepID=A0A2P2Q5J8_RHIMU
MSLSKEIQPQVLGTFAYI